MYATRAMVLEIDLPYILAKRYTHGNTWKAEYANPATEYLKRSSLILRARTLQIRAANGANMTPTAPHDIEQSTTTKCTYNRTYNIVSNMRYCCVSVFGVID